MMHTQRHTKIAGFTLIELLAAMGILVLIVLMMSRVFTDSTRMWELGTKRVEGAQEARAVVDFLVREISQAIADDQILFRAHSIVDSTVSFSQSAFGLDTHSIAFVTLTQTPPWGGSGQQARRRATSHFIYFVTFMRDDQNNLMDESHDKGPRYRLARMRKTRSAHWVAGQNPGLLDSAYHRTDWWNPDAWDALHDGFEGQNIETIANNVVAFKVWTYDGSGTEQFNYDSTAHGPPLWTDIYLQVLGDADMTRAAQLWGMDQAAATDFIERNSRRYSARIHFRNREGFAEP